MKKKEKKDIVDNEYLDMMIFNFQYAIDNNLANVYIGYVVVDDDYLKEYWVKKSDWIKTLDILINSAIELEEYEYCSKFKKLKELL
jgi:hypothetical protein